VFPKTSERASVVHRRQIHYSGRVQGVGFRYSTQRIANGYRVTGYVRNLADGRVQVVVEGEAEEVRGFVEELARKLGHYIRETKVQRAPATGEFLDFSIRY
jgi:acylphosphatase